ncbi:MAG TPA: hypothetical protein VFG15_24760 [Amycolatopsis sp.]|nr:hypothetical protein [Amycolatopsis sp.]
MPGVAFGDGVVLGRYAVVVDDALYDTATGRYWTCGRSGRLLDCCRAVRS